MVKIINAGRDEDNNIDIFGDVLYTLMYCQRDKYFEKVRMNKQTIELLKRKYKGVSEMDLIKRILFCNIIEDNSLGNEIITKTVRIIFDGDDLK